MLGIGGHEGVGQRTPVTVGDPLECTCHQGAVEVLGHWFDVGTPEQLTAARALFD